jgi:predicted AAA+ superfamily ATPase
MDERLFFSFNSWRSGRFHGPPETVRRDIHDRGMKYLREPEILILSGLRQTGKSTLLFQMIADLLADGRVPPDRIFYFTFDDFSLRQELSASHGAFLTILERLLGGAVADQPLLYVFIDEVQKLPGFVEYIKTLYDLRLPVKWILTGSASLELKAQVRESLAGRVLQLSISPFSEEEIFRGHKLPAPDKTALWEWIFSGNDPDLQALKRIQASLLPHRAAIDRFAEETILFGSLPAVAFARDREHKQTLLANYRNTYLDQDVRSLVREDKLWVYQRVMELLAGRTGDLLNFSNIASQIEVTVDTVKRYATLLEKTFLLHILTTCSRNVRNGVLKTPKTYFTDLGIRNALIGLTSLAQMERLNQLGVTLENAVVNRIVQRMVFAKETVRLHYWRTKTKEEVDLVIVTPERLLPIEIKSDKNIQARHLRGLRHFFAKEKERIGILVGRFDSVNVIEDGEKRICLLPFWML